jgi:diguanylate cyclase (GGDEF)-like protein/PAS domain S-box-containing protein
MHGLRDVPAVPALQLAETRHPGDDPVVPNGTPVAPKERLKRRAWIVYLAVMSAVSVAYLFGPSSMNNGPMFNLIGLSAVGALLLGTRVNRIERKLPWFLFALGQGLFVAGDVIAYNYQRFFHEELPFPSIADALYLAVYPALVAGILLLIRRRTPGRDRASLIDSLVIAVGTAVLSWVFLMAPYAHDAALSLPTKLISIAYPLMDILVLAVVARLVVGSGKRERSFQLLVLGVASLCVTDSVYGWLLLHGGYQTGGLLDGGWIVFYLLWGAAALHPSVRTISEAEQVPQVKLTRPRLALLATASLIAPIVQATEYVIGRRIDVPVVAAAGATLFLLVVARMAGLMREQERSEARFSSLVQNSSDVVTVIAADTTIRYVSPSVERVLGYRRAELERKPLIALLQPDDGPRALESFAALADEDLPSTALMEFSIRHRDGEWLEAETLRTNLLTDPTVEGIVLNTRDISERKAFERQLERHAFYDTVTGLANRALFRDRVDHALSQVVRTGLGVAVLFMDLDDFKVVNDSFGHAVGDALLKQVGERLTDSLRASDTAARLGGDEFAILLEETDDGIDPSGVAERILEALDTPFHVEGRDLGVRASIGIAFGNGKRGSEATEELLRNADVAMYMAKGQGKSRCEVYQPTMHKSMLRRLELKADLQRALEQNEFVLHYQPLINLATQEISGLEALVRWEHPERGTIPPLEFIPLAEETGLIIPLGSWVLDTACHEARRLQQQYPEHPPLSMSVNLSSRQLQWPGIVAEVRNALRVSGLQPSSLTLEVTESVMMQNVDLSVLRLRELKALQVDLAIDDFGAGYSSLNYIRRFPVDILKVDKSFVDRIEEGGEELALTAAIIDLAKVLKLRPVAEGVERAAQLERLLDLGCDFGQGYYFARPATIDVVEQRIAEERRNAA